MRIRCKTDTENIGLKLYSTENKRISEYIGTSDYQPVFSEPCTQPINRTFSVVNKLFECHLPLELNLIVQCTTSIMYIHLKVNLFLNHVITKLQSFGIIRTLS